MAARFGRRSKREEIAQRNAAFAMLAGGRDKVPAGLLTDLPKQRAPRKPIGKPLERNVLKAIIEALKAHPLVSRVVRNQSGTFQDGARTISVGYRGKPDLTVYLHSGRWGEIEVKRPGAHPNERQRKQLDRTIASGGFAGVAHSVAEAVGIIEAVK